MISTMPVMLSGCVLSYSPYLPAGFGLADPMYKPPALVLSEADRPRIEAAIGDAAAVLAVLATIKIMVNLPIRPLFPEPYFDGGPYSGILREMFHR